ncbi:MAG: PEGA domain-containing protein [Acidobacteriota bacterium]|nr:PEGA domain-containing protein [Acidobacteriota bacterium]
MAAAEAAAPAAPATPPPPLAPPPPVAAPVVAAPPPPPVPEPVPVTQAPALPVEPMTQPEAAPEPRKSGGKKLAVILGAAILLVAAAGGAAWYFFLRGGGAGSGGGSKAASRVLAGNGLDGLAQVGLVSEELDEEWDETPAEPAEGAPAASGQSVASNPSQAAGSAQQPQGGQDRGQQAKPPAQSGQQAAKPQGKNQPAPSTAGTSPSVAAPTGTYARLSVKTAPGVSVFLDGRSLGTTNGAGELHYDEVPPGMHEVAARLAGHAEVKQNLQFATGGQQFISLELKKLLGNLSVTVNVANADIAVKGAGHSGTYQDKVTALALPEGDYDVVVSKPGYNTSSQRVHVGANQGKGLTVTLASSYAGARSGTLVWEGEVRDTDLVTIENGKASAGKLTGDPLPGVPCQVQSSDTGKVTVDVAPGPENQYRGMTLRVAGKKKVKVSLKWTVTP